MASPDSPMSRAIAQRRVESGLGVGCAEAQADGVPCDEPSRDCDRCAKAAEGARAAAPRRPPARPRAPQPKRL